MHIVKVLQPPTGLSRLVYRLPIHVYRLGLGRIFGSRLLLLQHVGRRTGMQRQSVLEVVEHDRTDGSFVVASGWGASSAWYRNVVHTPAVSIQVANRTLAVTAVPIPAEEGEDVFARYVGHHPIAAKWLLPRLQGIAVDGSQADFRAVGRHLPFVRFVPRA